MVEDVLLHFGDVRVAEPKSAILEPVSGRRRRRVKTRIKDWEYLGRCEGNNPIRDGEYIY